MSNNLLWTFEGKKGHLAYDKVVFPECFVKVNKRPDKEYIIRNNEMRRLRGEIEISVSDNFIKSNSNLIGATYGHLKHLHGDGEKIIEEWYFRDMAVVTYHYFGHMFTWLIAYEKAFRSVKEGTVRGLGVIG